MPRITRVLTSLLAGLLMIAGALVLAGPSTAAPTTSTVAAPHANPGARPPCGRRHYPPCPPRKHLYVSPHNVRRGHTVTVTVQNYPSHVKVVVHLAGHHRYILLGSTRTSSRGNAQLSVRIPKHIPTGGYTLAVLIGSSNHRIGIRVIRG